MLPRSLLQEAFGYEKHKCLKDRNSENDKHYHLDYSKALHLEPGVVIDDALVTELKSAL